MRRPVFSQIALVLTVLSISGLLASAAEPAKEFTAQQRRWWAIQPLQTGVAPAVGDASWVRNEIDAFVLSRLESKQLRPNPAADRQTWLRRATLDITGLPPTPEEIRNFENDRSDFAFQKVVDRLLSSPRYGERWARHWLDLARYADSEGFKSDETRPNIWRYRDYVIRSFNQDKPYDRFVKEQIAGDELYPQNADALVATGFNRHFPDESNARNLMQRRQELLNDVTDTVAYTFMGLTYACARCHDHKFDAILQKDYYRLQAFFANTRIEDQASLLSEERKARWQREHDVWSAKTKDIRDEMARLVEPASKALYQESFEKYPEEIQQAILAKPEERTPFQWQMYHKARWLLTIDEASAAKKLKGPSAARYAELKTQLAGFDSIRPETLPVAQAMVDNDEHSPKTFLLRAGAYDAPLSEVQPGFLSILDPTDAKITPPAGGHTTGRRSALANWLASETNPLTPRVIVNRVWHYHFGRGIVGTPSDFGVMGERPANKELLDWLTSDFIAHGWSIKRLHRQILLSNTYRQSSDLQPAAAKVDPDDKLLWRFPRRRLEGEAIRDSMLYVSGLLNEKEGGPGVFPPMPAGVETRGGWKKNEAVPDTLRRSVYIFVRRNTRYPMLETFDMPDTHESCSRRSQTVSPTQALDLMNNELVLDWSRHLAGRILNDTGLTTDALTDRAWKLSFGRPATPDERSMVREFLERHTPIVKARLEKREAVPVPANLPAGVAPETAAAWVDLCHMLLNSNEFVYLN